MLAHPFFKEFSNPGKEVVNNKRLTTDVKFNRLVEVREVMYKMVTEIQETMKMNTKTANYYAKYDNYN